MGQHTSIQPDLVATIEACYRVEQTSEQWLRGVMETLSWLDQGLGIFGFTYTLTQTCELEADPPIALGCPAQIVAALPAGLGLWWSVLDRDKRGWHDRWTGTRVVRAAGYRR